MGSIKSTYSFSFYSHELNKGKHERLYAKAELIRDLKNRISEKVCANPLLLLELNGDAFVTKFNCQVEGLVAREIQPALYEVHKCYANKVDSFKDKATFVLQNELSITRYKKATGANKKGDVKSFEVTHRRSDLSKVLTFLAKHWNKGLVDYLIKEKENKDKSEAQIKFYKDVLFYLHKYGDRLTGLALMKREALLRKIFSEPILFKSLTYSAVNTAAKIVDVNKNNKSELSHFLSLSGFNGKKLCIPIKHSQRHHEDIEAFNKNQPTYMLQFVKDRVRVILSKPGERSYAEDKRNIFSADVNLKHNLFSCTDDHIVDFDREKLKNYVKTQLKFEKKHDLLYKSFDEDLNARQLKKKQKMLFRNTKWLCRLNYHYKEKAAELLKLMQQEGYDHLALEDLGMFDKGYMRSEEFFGLKYSRLVRILHLSDFKNIFETQCSNRDIQLTLVPAPYTSQRCSKEGCGYVDSRNRKTQEIFKCLCCGHEMGADFNSHRNIKKYAESDVLSQAFLKKDKRGWMVPKTSNKHFIKKHLDDLFEKNQQNKNYHSCSASNKLDAGVMKNNEFIAFHENL